VRDDCAGAHPHRNTQFCAIRSYLSTAAKHGMLFFDVFVMLAEDRPWLRATQ
jgi:transposase